MLVNVGQAETDLSKLLARVEAGEPVEIARDGVPVARLIRIERPTTGARFLAAHRSLAGRISMADDVEFTDDELDELLDERIAAYEVPLVDAGPSAGPSVST